MATECIFVEGGNATLDPSLVGLPLNSRFRLSPKPIAYNLAAPVFGDLYPGEVYSGVGEITGWTGANAYNRITVPTPTPVNKIVTWGPLLWQVGAAVDGPTNVRSLVLEDPVLLRAICAWDLRMMVQTTLTSDVPLPSATIDVVSTTSLFKTAGSLNINGQSIAYTGKTATQFTGCTGGTGTVPAGSYVVQDALDLSTAVANAQISISTLRLFMQNIGGT